MHVKDQAEQKFYPSIGMLGSHALVFLRLPVCKCQDPALLCHTVCEVGG